MSTPNNFSIKVKNYKCFGDEETGFDEIKYINLIIGRNNSGKSSLLEVIQYVTNPQDAFMLLGHKGSKPSVLITTVLTEETIKSVFQPNVHGGGIPGPNHWEYGKKWIGRPIKYELNPKRSKSFVSIDPPFEHQNRGSQEGYLASRAINPLGDKVFFCLRAERNIVPEGAYSELQLEENGRGATNLIQGFINRRDLPNELVEQNLLTALNTIYSPDSRFSRILAQSSPDGNTWEIFLDEPNKGTIALSHTGSGFKTILLVLEFLYLIPFVKKLRVENLIFAFEELENNMHPALQRRLLAFLRDFALKNECIFFLTTHSSVVIDMFSRDEQAQIIHVTHDGEKALAKRVQTYIDNSGVLDDLDVRASDLLLANSVIWVEGPSDRLYINRWIELWENGALKEGIHYQCVFYAGRLLAHISAEEPEQATSGGVAILRLNRHAAVLMDSDKDNESDTINETKKRIVAEVGRMGGIVWITDGREVENYLPHEAIGNYYGRQLQTPLEKFKRIEDYIQTEVGKEQRKGFEKSKVEFAAKICPRLTRESISNNTDLSSKLANLCQKIKKWNNLA